MQRHMKTLSQYSDKTDPHLLVSFWLGLLLAILLLPGQAWSACPGGSDTPVSATLTILHTNDLHAHLLPSRTGKGGLANLAAYIKQVRASEPNVLVLDAGDMTQGTPVSSLFLGKPVFEVMNAIGYDAATLGNHEFDNGPSLIAEYRAIARFPLISANILIGGKPATGIPTLVRSVNGIKIGLLGLTNSTANESENEAVRVLDPEETVRKVLPGLRKQASFVIALSHLGLEADRALAARIPGIDVMIGGHSHSPLKEPLKVGHTIIAQAGFQGMWVGRLDLTLDLDKCRVTASEGRLIDIPVPGLQPDPATRRVVSRWEDQVTSRMDIEIGRNPSPLTVEQVTRRIERIWRETYRADFAWQNPGGTRGDLSAGPIRIRDIYNIMPFNNTLVVLDLDPAQVTKMLGTGEFSSTPEKPLYTLITNSYAAKKIIRQFKLPLRRIHEFNISWRQPVIESVKRCGSLDTPTHELVQGNH